MAAHDENELYENEGPSRTRRKRNAAELKELGDQLVALPPTELARLPLSEKLRDAIELAHRITAHGGAARQRQLIGKLLRHTDVAAIRATIQLQLIDQRIAAREFHRLEIWRNRLIEDGESAIVSLLASEPALDGQRLRSLVDTAQLEAALGRPPAASRELFRWLRTVLGTGGTKAEDRT
ncbi:MAG: ribosome biogenesis factor YjgA [Pseudomonadota bacterium]